MKMAENDSSEIVKEQSESVAATNLKVLGDGPAFYANMGMANSTAHQQAMQTIQQATVAKMVELIANTSPTEGGADVAGMQALAKIVGNIPPVTP
jgi:curli biogenesis system outer membrane secretion channel CsgG